MSEEVNISYYCPYCESDSILMINANSANDYNIVDEVCPNCDAQIEGGVIDKLAYDAVADHFSSSGDFSHELD